MPSQPGAAARRPQPREVVELNRLRADHPELATAVDLQLGLIALQHRVQARMPVPWIDVDPAWLKQQQRAGRPLLRFEDIPLNWTDLRLTFRETADLLHRFDALEEPDYRQAQALSRDGHALEPLLVRWYRAAAEPDKLEPADAKAATLSGGVEQVLLLAARPFLARCAEAVLHRLDLSEWSLGTCPLCGGEPELAVITHAAERLLICGRCTGRWRFAPLDCPYCGNADRGRITSFTSRDGLYRLYACDVCRRYLKAFDSRHASRPVMLPVELVATLPLDAAAMQKGYS